MRGSTCSRPCASSDSHQVDPVTCHDETGQTSGERKVACDQPASADLAAASVCSQSGARASAPFSGFSFRISERGEKSRTRQRAGRESAECSSGLLDLDGDRRNCSASPSSGCAFVYDRAAHDLEGASTSSAVASGRAALEFTGQARGAGIVRQVDRARFGRSHAGPAMVRVFAESSGASTELASVPRGTRDSAESSGGCVDRAGFRPTRGQGFRGIVRCVDRAGFRPTRDQRFRGIVRCVDRAGFGPTRGQRFRGIVRCVDRARFGLTRD